MKVVKLPALRTGLLYLQGVTPHPYFCSRLSRHQDYNVAGWIKSMKNPSETSVDRTRDLPLGSQCHIQLRMRVPQVIFC